MKLFTVVLALFLASNLMAMGEKPAEHTHPAQDITQGKAATPAPSQALADKDLPKLASDKIQPPYNPKVARSLLYKLKKDLPLTDAERAHFEMVYEKAHVGEEELTPEDQLISPFTYKVMDHKVRVAIERRTQKYEMVGPDLPQNAPKAP